jgi:hypothetical protein
VNEEIVDKQCEPSGLVFVAGPEHVLLSYMKSLVPHGAQTQGRIKPGIQVYGSFAINGQAEHAFGSVNGRDFQYSVRSTEYH